MLFARRIRGGLLWGATLAAVCCVATSAQARPEYAKKENVNCLHCHIEPGGERNFRGLYYAAHKHSFDGFDELFESKMAGVPPNQKGPDAKPANPDYPRYKIAPALQFAVKNIDGKTINLGRYEGKIILVVNVASKCGNTPQYASLEKLYEKYKEKGFVVLGFPANDFLKQEPGTDMEIKEFCRATYSVKFPMFSKIVVKGEGQAPLYKFLTDKKSDPKFGGDIEWNFAKFLINRKGEIVARFPAGNDPAKPEVVSVIEKELNAPKPKKAEEEQ